MSEFRFEDLKVWQQAMVLTLDLLILADLAENKKYYKFSEQLRGATLSITNNIAEGSGSDSDRDFARFLGISRRSLYECVNMLYVFEAWHIIDQQKREALYPSLLSLSKQLTNFRKALLKKAG